MFHRILIFKYTELSRLFIAVEIINFYEVNILINTLNVIKHFYIKTFFISL